MILSLVSQLSEYELAVAADIVDPLTLPISWKDIGGLRETVDEVKVRIAFSIYFDSKDG